MAAIETSSVRMMDPVRVLCTVAGRGFADAREATRAIFGLIHDLIGLRTCIVTRLDVVDNALTILEASDKTGLGMETGSALNVDDMPCTHVVRLDVGICASEIAECSTLRQLPLHTKLGVHSYVGVPLRRSDGTVWGTLAAFDTTAREVTDSHLETMTVLGRLIAFEFECEEQRDKLAAHARMLTERLAMAEELEGQRLRAVRLQAVLEAAATVSHEVNNPLTVLQLRLGRLEKRCSSLDSESADDIAVALEAATEINQVTVSLRSVVRPVSTHYLTGKSRMLDLVASTERLEPPVELAPRKTASHTKSR